MFAKRAAAALERTLPRRKSPVFAKSLHQNDLFLRECSKRVWVKRARAAEVLELQWLHRSLLASVRQLSLGSEGAVHRLDGAREAEHQLVPVLVHDLAVVATSLGAQEAPVAFPGAEPGCLVPGHQGRVAHDVGEQDRGQAALGAGQPVEAAEGEPFDLSLLRSRAFHGFGLALEPATTAAVVAAGRAATGPAAAMERQVAEDIVKLLEQGYSPVVPSGAAKREKKISPALRALRAELEQAEAEVAALEKDKREMARAVDGASSLTASRGSTPAT